MTKHTPGPWELSVMHSVSRKSQVYRITNQHGAAVVPYLDAVDAEEMSEEVGIANARLITAAPDLLEALKDIAGRDWVENALDPQWAAGIARAAIAKAEGKE